MAQLEIPPPKLVIEPFEYVLVEPPFNEPKHWKLRLVNPHSRSIIFKIKTTAATEFGVKPRVGVLAPNAESSIRFTLLHRPDRPAPTPEFISKQLFQLHSRYPVDNELSDIAAIDDPQDPKRAEALINDLFKKQHPTLPFTMPCFVGKDNVTANPPPRGKGLDSISVASSFASTALPPPSARQGGLQHSASVGSMDLAAATASHGSVAASRSGTLQRLDSMRRARAAAQASAAKAWGGGAAAAPDAALVTSLLAKVADLAKVVEEQTASLKELRSIHALLLADPFASTDAPQGATPPPTPPVQLEPLMKRVVAGGRDARSALSAVQTLTASVDALAARMAAIEAPHGAASAGGGDADLSRHGSNLSSVAVARAAAGAAARASAAAPPSPAAAPPSTPPPATPDDAVARPLPVAGGINAAVAAARDGAARDARPSAAPAAAARVAPRSAPRGRRVSRVAKVLFVAVLCVLAGWAYVAVGDDAVYHARRLRARCDGGVQCFYDEPIAAGFVAAAVVALVIVLRVLCM